MQMEENKQKKELEKKQNKLYDNQRLAINEQVNRNEDEFTKRNLAVSLQTQEENIQRDQMRKTNERDNKQAEMSRDQQELAWTNSTQLRYTEKKSYADKYLK